MIHPQSIQAVISRADIVEIVGQFVSLKRRGTNYIGNCPFHNEKTPSFNVNPAKGIFKCFGCGKGGDVVSFIEEYEKFTFYETIRWLANFYQITLEETEVTETVKQQIQVEESLRIVNAFAANYFEDILWNHDEGRLIGLSYFKEREFSDQTIKSFQLGYSLEAWDSFYTHALANGFTKEILEKAGLIRLRDNGQLYDTYRGRVIFPISSPTGKILGFGARILKTDGKQPKYINTQENELYIKNKVLYGLYQSRQSIAKLDECLLVEGYTDVISLHQAGITNVVASSGTALTEGQLKLISNLTKQLTILYDGDTAGVKAALRGLDKALSEGFNVKLVLLPEGEDPDSYVKRIGEKYFRAYILENKQDIISFKLAVGLKEAGNDAVKKSQLVNEVAETISKINKLEDFALRSYYIKHSAQQLAIDEQGLINLVNKYLRDQVKLQQRHASAEKHQQQPIDTEPEFHLDENGMLVAPETTPPMAETVQSTIDWALIKILIEYGNRNFKDEGTIATAIRDTIDEDLIEDAFAKELFQLAMQQLDKDAKIPDLPFFVNHADKRIREAMASILNDDFVPSAGWKEVVKIEVPFGEAVYEQDLDSIFMYFELKLIRKSIAANLKEMEAEKDQDKLLRYMMVHQKLKEKEKALQKFVILK